VAHAVMAFTLDAFSSKYIKGTQLARHRDTIYKLKFFLDQAPIDNTDNAVGKEGEEAVRAIMYMLHNKLPLRKIKTEHYVVVTTVRPWKAGKLVQFKQNGVPLTAHNDEVRINFASCPDIERNKGEGVSQRGGRISQGSSSEQASGAQPQDPGEDAVCHVRHRVPWTNESEDHRSVKQKFLTAWLFCWQFSSSLPSCYCFAFTCKLISSSSSSAIPEKLISDGYGCFDCFNNKLSVFIICLGFFLDNILHLEQQNEAHLHLHRVKKEPSQRSKNLTKVGGVPTSSRSLLAFSLALRNRTRATSQMKRRHSAFQRKDRLEKVQVTKGSKLGQ
jgi:hypothetical protein